MRRGSVLGAIAAAALALLCGGFARGDVPDAAASTRLAVIAQGQSAPCRGLADLLQVELSQRDGIELVERETIDRVLAEQALTASGLVAESTRISLGALLKADGLLFVDQTIPTNNVFQLRLVETTQGYVAGFMIHKAGTPMAQTLAALDRSLANLSLSADLRVGVSVLAFRNGLSGDLKTHPIVQAFMAGVEERLMVELAAIPGALILERRKLGDVVQEEALSGDARALLAGTLLVDGGLTLAPEIGAQKDTKPQVVLSFRLRNLATGESKVVEAKGNLFGLRSLERLALDDLLVAAREVRAQAGAGALQAEVSVLDDLVRRHYLLWAGEAAAALDGADRQRVETFLMMLVAKFDDLLDDRAKALTLARIEATCREHGLSLPSVLGFFVSQDVLNYLKRQNTFWDPELRRLLQPLRTNLLAKLDSSEKAKSAMSFDKSVAWLSGVIAQPSERRRRVGSWVEKLQADPGTTPAMRYFLSTYPIYAFRWGSEDLKRFSKTDDPVLRFHANRILLRNARTRPEQLAHSDAMMADLDAVLSRTTGVSMEWHFFHTGSKVAKSGQEYTPNRWPSEAMRDLYLYRHEWKETVQRKLFERLKGLLAEEDFGTIHFLECNTMLTTIPEREVFDWVCDAIQRGKAIKPGRQAFASTSVMVPFLEKWRDEVLARHPEFRDGVRLQERVLLSAQTDGARINALAPRPAGANRGAKLSIQRLLLDGDALWVGVSGEPEGVRGESYLWYYFVGLLEIDLKSGRLMSERGRWFLLDGANSRVRYMFDVDAMARSGDYLALLHSGVGVVAVPIQEKGMQRCRLLGFREGLPMSDNDMSLRFEGSMASLHGGVCIGLGQWLVHWDFESWRSRILLDMEDFSSSLGYEGKIKSIGGITYKPEMDDYWLAVNIYSRQSVASRSSSYSISTTHFRGNAFTGDWKEVAANEMPPPSERSMKTERAWQALKEALTSNLGDVVVWRDQIIAIHGSDADHWALSAFSPFEQEDVDEN